MQREDCMVGNYDITIDSLAQLITTLNNSKNIYTGNLKLHKEHFSEILLLMKPIDDFLQKLLCEYKRLTGSTFRTENFPVDVMFLQDETELKLRCADLLDHLIEAGAELLNKDILWEVLPVLANNLVHLIGAKEQLLNSFSNKIEQYS